MKEKQRNSGSERSLVEGGETRWKTWQESRRVKAFEWTASFAGGEKEGKEESRPRLAALIPLANAWRVAMSRVETSRVQALNSTRTKKSTRMSLGGKSSRLSPPGSYGNETLRERKGKGKEANE